MSEIADDAWKRLTAYHDGELRGIARWRFERELARDAGLRRELQELGRIGALVRATPAAAGSPDLWDGIALRLPAVDARRTEAPAAEGFRGWLRPAGALAVAAAVTLAIWLGSAGPGSPSGGAVRWVDGRGKPLMVLDAAEESGVTIIWVLEDAVEGAARGVGREMA